MADTEDQVRGESTRRPKEEAPKTKDYVLREGASLNTIENGEHITRTGDADGNATVHLTEDQALAFSDKLDLKATPQERNMRNATTMVIGEHTGGAATISEGAALAGRAEGITGDSEEDVDGDKTVDRPAANRTVDVSKVGNTPADKKASETKSEAKSEEGKSTGAGQTGSAAGQAAAAHAPAGGENKK
jgi:hypothetical protein